MNETFTFEIATSGEVFTSAPDWLVWFGFLLTWWPLILSFLFVWSFFWKGLALWHSARRAQPWWFVILLFVNTLGILEIIYLFAIAQVKMDKLFSKEV